MTGRPTTFAQSYFHGTKADLKAGDLIRPGFASNYGRPNATHVYLTSTLEAAIWGAELAAGEGAGHIYVVEPMGSCENDPELTDQKFAGNPTQSYRTSDALRVIGKVVDWEGHSLDQIQATKEHVAKLEGGDFP